MENCLGGNRRNMKAQQKDLQQLKSQQQLQPPNQNYYTQNPTSTQQKRLPTRSETTTTTAIATKEPATPPNNFLTDCLHFPPPPEYPPTPTVAATPIMPTGPTATTAATTKSSTTALQSQGSTIVSVAELQQHSQQQRQKQQQHQHQQQQKQTLKVQIDKKPPGNGTGNDAKPVSLSKNSPTTAAAAAALPLPSSSTLVYERRQVPPPRYPDPDPDAIEVCNEHEPTHAQSTDWQFKTLGHRTRSDLLHANVKWSREPENVNFQLLQMHQNSTHHQRQHYAAQNPHQHQHDYSYAYYEPGAAMRHANVPPPEGVVPSSSSPSANLSEVQTNPTPPPPNSMRALLSKGRKNKLLSTTSLRHGYQMPYNSATMGDLIHGAATSSATGQTGSGENFYEEISSNDTSPHCMPHTKSNSKSVGALGPSLVEQERRRVQNRHRKILGELNLSVEAMLMPESPPSLSPTKPNEPTVCVTAASGQPILNSSALPLRLSSSSADNICDPYNYTGPADDFISPIQPADLDSGFSGSSAGASSIGTLRLHKTNAKGSSFAGECKPHSTTASGLHSFTLSSSIHSRTLQRANTTTTIPTILTINQRQQKPHEGTTTSNECAFLTRASCGRRILNCAKIRAAEDPGPTVPRPESKARSFWNRKGWRKFPGFASTSSIDSTGLTTDEHKLNSPTGWEESLPSENPLKTTTFIGNTSASGQLHNPILVHRTACNGSKALATPANNNTNGNTTTTCTSSEHQHQQLLQPQQPHTKSCSQSQSNEADHKTALVFHTGSTIAGGSFSTNGNSAAVGVSEATAATAASTTAETDTIAAKERNNDDGNNSIGCNCDCQSNNINSSIWCTDLKENGSNSSSSVTNTNTIGNSNVIVDSSNEDITSIVGNSTSCVEEQRSNVTSSLSATNQRNSQLRSTFSRAKQHLSFDKWRSGGGGLATATNSGSAASNSSANDSGATDSNVCGVGSSATLQSNRRASASVAMPTAAHQSPREHDLTAALGESSPGGRLSRWFSIRRGSSHQYDINARGNDARQSSSSSIDIPDAATLAYGEQQSSPQKLSGSGCGGSSTMGYKMPGVPENEDDDPSAYSTSSAARFDMDLIIPPGSRANGTARTANERLIAPMLPPAPPGLSQQQLKRRHIIAAIVHSENSYVATLQRLVNDYKKPLEESNPPVLSASKIGTLFHRLPDILQSHKLFRISLAECVRNWDRDEKLGDCFVSTFSKPRILEIYSGFINNFSAAMELAKMEEKRKSALADFFKVKQISAHDRLSFFGLMVKPVQRFPQFILFLQDLLKYTPQGHHDRMSLQLALTQLELLAEMLNERKREAEQYQGFKEMLGHISGTFNTRSLTSSDGNRPRYLLREDNVTHMEFNQAGMIVKSKQRRLLLLNDKVICVSVAPKQSHDFGATEKLTFKWMYPVTDVEIVDNSTSATLSRILTAGLNRGGSLKSNSSSCNNYSTNTLPVGVTSTGTMLDTSPAVQLTNGADNLCNEMSTLMYDYEVISRIHDLVGSLKGTYKELNTSITRNLLNGIQGSIQRKNEEMAWVDSCILQLIARNKSGKEETYTFQTLNPSVKKEWITELRLAQLALDTNNSPAWEVTTTESSKAVFGCYGEQHQQQQQQQLLQHKQSNKMPLFVKAMPVYKSQHQTEVRCGCYYTITNDIKLTGNARRRHKQQNYLWICTSDGTSSHIAVLSQHHQRAGNLRDVGSFDLVETQVTSMEFVKGFDNCCKPREDSGNNLLGDLIWMGTDSRKLFIYSAQNPEQEEQLSFCTVPGAIMRILYHFDAVYVALSNAMVLIYRRSYDGTWMLKDPQVVQLGDSGLAVPSLLPINMNIYAACANRVYVLNALNGEVQKSFEVQHGANQQVNLMAHSGIGLWISLKNSTVLCLYHTETFKHLQDINIATSVLRNDSKKEKTVNNSSIYVTALMACKGLLWVGTNVGIAVTIPLPRLEGVPIIGGGISMSCHAHFGPITFLLPLIPKVYPNYKPPSASQAPLATLSAELMQPHTPSMGENLQLPAIDADPKKLTEADLDESTVILRRDLPKEELSSGNASPSAGTLREANSNTDSNASSPRSSKLEKQNSLDQSFSAKIRASLANSPAFHRKRFRDLSAESARMSKTLPRGLGSAGFFSTSPHSNVSTLSHTDHGYCDVYGLYGKLIFVKEDYDAVEGTQGNLIDMMYEGMRRSDPELAAIPGKVTTLDRRLRMKAARPRSLDLSNWSVDSKSSSLYTSSGSEESMGIRLFGGRSVSRNSSSASHKTSGNGSDLGNISENGLMTTVEIHQHSTPKSEDGFKLMLADCKPNSKLSISPNASTNAVATLPVSAAAATLKRKQKQNAKQQQQQQNADGPRTIITLTGGRGYWRHVWYNNSHSPGNKTATLSSNAPSPLTANSNDAHIVIWEKKL